MLPAKRKSTFYGPYTSLQTTFNYECTSISFLNQASEHFFLIIWENVQNIKVGNAGYKTICNMINLPTQTHTHHYIFIGDRC